MSEIIEQLEIANDLVQAKIEQELNKTVDESVAGNHTLKFSKYILEDQQATLDASTGKKLARLEKRFGFWDNAAETRFMILLSFGAVSFFLVSPYIWVISYCFGNVNYMDEKAAPWLFALVGLHLTGILFGLLFNKLASWQLKRRWVTRLKEMRFSKDKHGVSVQYLDGKISDVDVDGLIATCRREAVVKFEELDLAKEFNDSDENVWDLFEKIVKHPEAIEIPSLRNNTLLAVEEYFELEIKIRKLKLAKQTSISLAEKQQLISSSLANVLDRINELAKARKQVGYELAAEVIKAEQSLNDRKYELPLEV